MRKFFPVFAALLLPVGLAFASPAEDCNRAITHINAHAYDKAKPVLQAIIKDTAASARVRSRAYYAYCVITPSPADALRFCEKASELTPDDGAVLLRTAGLRLSLGDAAAAEKDADRALALHPAMDAAYAVRGVARHRLARSQEALADFDKAVSLNPTCAAHIRRAVALYDLGKDADALNDLKAAMQCKPDAQQKALVAWCHGKILYRAGKFDTAEKVLGFAAQHLTDTKKKGECAALLRRIASQKEWM